MGGVLPAGWCLVSICCAAYVELARAALIKIANNLLCVVQRERLTNRTVAREDFHELFGGDPSRLVDVKDLKGLSMRRCGRLSWEKEVLKVATRAAVSVAAGVGDAFSGNTRGGRCVRVTFLAARDTIFGIVPQPCATTTRCALARSPKTLVERGEIECAAGGTKRQAT